MRNPWAAWSRPAKVLIGLGAVLALIALTGVLGSSGTEVEKEEALAIAGEVIDFQPTQTTVRLVRQGFPSRPFWAVSFSIRGEQGEFERITTVVVDGTTGEIVEVNRTG